MATTVTNANVDTGAAAIAAPYGPLTRVTDITTLATPNSDLRLEFTTALSTTVYMTYDELVDADMSEGILAQHFNFQDVLEQAVVLIDTLNTAAAALVLPHTYANWKDIWLKTKAVAELMGVWHGQP
jgi:hypothetical protein